jgi:hypothetical protein
MTSSKTKKRQTLLLKSSILTIAAAVMFSLFAAPLISQQSVMAQIGPSPESNNMSSSSANMSTTTTSVGEAPGSVFKLSRASIPIDIPLIEGFVNGNPVFYINTDISDQKLASQLTSTTGFRVNYAPLLAQAPNDGVAEFYVLKNGIKGTGTLGFQPTVGNAQPGDTKYSPLWKINIVEWKNGITPTQPKSEKEVMDAKAKGDLTVTPTNIVANCPFVRWNGGEMTIREDKNINDDSKYMGGQVLKIDTDKMVVTMVAHRGFGPDGKTIYYIVPDATPQMPAAMMGVTFASLDEKLLSSAALVDLFQFTNGINGSGPMGFQAGIGAANPTDPNYSPMWKISFNEWKDPSKARILETVTDITSMKQAGMITITPAMGGKHVVNCPLFDASTVFEHQSRSL